MTPVVNVQIFKKQFQSKFTIMRCVWSWANHLFLYASASCCKFKALLQLQIRIVEISKSSDISKRKYTTKLHANDCMLYKADITKCLMTRTQLNRTNTIGLQLSLFCFLFFSTYFSFQQFFFWVNILLIIFAIFYS